MPHIQINGASIYYEEHGDGSETIVFSRGLLWSGYLFHNQIDVLKDRYRCVTDQLGRRYDLADRVDAFDYVAAGGKETCGKIITSAAHIAAGIIMKKTGPNREPRPDGAS